MPTNCGSRVSHLQHASRRRRLTETIAAGVETGEFAARIDSEAAPVAGAMFYRRLMTADAPDTDFVTRVVNTVLGA